VTRVPSSGTKSNAPLHGYRAFSLPTTITISASSTSLPRLIHYVAVVVFSKLLRHAAPTMRNMTRDHYMTWRM